MNSVVFTIRYVAELLGADEEFLDKLAYPNLDLEHGRLTVVLSPGSKLDENTMTAFTDGGIENLRELLAEYKRHPWDFK